MRTGLGIVVTYAVLKARAEDSPQEAGEASKKRKGDEISRVRERLDEGNGVVAPVAQQRARHDEHEGVDGYEVRPRQNTSLSQRKVNGGGACGGRRCCVRVSAAAAPATHPPAWQDSPLEQSCEYRGVRVRCFGVHVAAAASACGGERWERGLAGLWSLKRRRKKMGNRVRNVKQDHLSSAQVTSRRGGAACLLDFSQED